MCFESTPNEVAPEHTAEVNLRNLVTKNSQTLGAVTQRVARVARNNEDAERGRRRQSVLVDTRTASEKILSAEDIEKMFAWTYLKYPIGIQHFVFFFLWGPIGAVLVVVRLTVLALFAGLMYCLPNAVSDVITPILLINVILPICGIFVYASGRENLEGIEKPYILAGNHMSNFDPFFMNALERTSTLVGTGNTASIWYLCTQIGLIRDGGIICTAPMGTIEEKLKVKEGIDRAVDGNLSGPAPLLIFPEGTVANSRVALLLYQKYVFSLGKTIVPVAMTIWNPWPYEHYWMGGSFVDCLFAYIFSPFLVFSYTALEPLQIKEGETAIEFSSRCQYVTAQHLGIGVSTVHWKEQHRALQALGYSKINDDLWKDTSIDEYQKAMAARIQEDRSKRERRMSVS